MSTLYIKYPNTAAGDVISLNGLTGALTLVAGSGITITPSGSNITIASSVVDTGITQLTGDVTAGPGSGSQAATIAANAVTNAKAAQMATNTIKGNNTGGTANALDLTISQVQTMLGTSGTNTGDVTLASFGSSPSANAASLSGQVLTLQPADGTHPGGVSTATQHFGGNKTFDAQVGIVGAPNTNVLLDIGGGTNPLSTVAQTGIVVEMTSTSSATTRTAGVQSGISTDAAAYTTALATNFYSLNIGKGAGSTITNAVNYYLDENSNGTNNAALADNNSFSGNWFINYSGTRASTLGGSLTANSVGVGTSANVISGLSELDIKAATNSLTIKSPTSQDCAVFFNTQTDNQDSRIYAQITAGSTTGHAYFAALNATGNKWSFGLNQQASSAWQLANTDGFGTASKIYLQASTAGVLTLGAGSGNQQHVLNTSTGTPASGVGTLSNLPTGKSGNPTGYIQITINGSTAFIPFW